LQQVLGTPPPHVAFVPIDFDEQKLEDALAAAGFRTGTKTFFIWEGVTQYITAEAVDTTFQYVSRATAPGSEIVFTYIHRGIIDGSARSETDEIFVSATQRGGMPWIFGLDPAELTGYLAARGLALVDHAGASEYRTRYLDPLGRQMSIYAGERMALAQVVGN
jgi:methyltransferase (TIGR00027 family)